MDPEPKTASTQPTTTRNLSQVLLICIYKSINKYIYIYAYLSIRKYNYDFLQYQFIL